MVQTNMCISGVLLEWRWRAKMMNLIWTWFCITACDYTRCFTSNEQTNLKYSFTSMYGVSWAAAGAIRCSVNRGKPTAAGSVLKETRRWFMSDSTEHVHIYSYRPQVCVAICATFSCSFQKSVDFLCPDRVFRTNYQGPSFGLKSSEFPCLIDYFSTLHFCWPMKLTFDLIWSSGHSTLIS